MEPLYQIKRKYVCMSRNSRLIKTEVWPVSESTKPLEKNDRFIIYQIKRK